MNDKDKEAFEKWWEENIDGPNVNYVFLKPSKKLFADAWRGACEYKDVQLISENKKVTEYKELARLQADTITRLERENKKLRDALEHIQTNME